MTVAIKDQTAELTTLYRIRDAEDRLLYVGISRNVGKRMAEHSGDKPWWSEATRVDLEHYESRQEARTAEWAAIRNGFPLYNVQGRIDPAAFEALEEVVIWSEAMRAAEVERSNAARMRADAISEQRSVGVPLEVIAKRLGVTRQRVQEMEKMGSATKRARG